MSNLNRVQWEYKTLKFEPKGFFGGKTNPAEIEDGLNSLGRNGWEVTGVIETNATSDRTRHVVILLKRPVTRAAPQRDDTAKITVKRAGQKLGEWTINEIRGFLNSGSLKNDDAYFDSSSGAWLPLDQHPFL